MSLLGASGWARSGRRRAGAAGLVALCLACALGGAIAQATPSPMVRIEPAAVLPRGAQDLGPVRPSVSVSGAIVLRSRNAGALTRFLREVAKRHSAAFHAYLRPDSFAARFGPGGEAIRTVTGMLRADRLRVTGPSGGGLVVGFTGSARRVEDAFHTRLIRYRLATGQIGRATVAPIRLQADVAGYVASVAGLSDLGEWQPAAAVRGASRRRSASHIRADFAHPSGSATPCAHATATAGSAGGLTDDQIAHAYGAFGLYGAGDFGAGQRIGILALEPFSQSDLKTFDECYFGTSAGDQIAGHVSVRAVDEGLPSGPGSGKEITDIEDVSAIAPQANIDVYEAPNTGFGLLDAYAQMVNSDTDQVILTTWSQCEQALQQTEPGLQQAENVLFQQAAAQGQTVVAPTGDTGSDACDVAGQAPPPAGQNLLSVDDPASQLYVLAVGGTTITNPTQPAQEQVWNAGNGGGGGGGISESWLVPSWQNGLADAADTTNAANLESATAGTSAPDTTPTFCAGTLGMPGAQCRLVPDVSAQADPVTGAITTYSTAQGGWTTSGGTSSAAAIWAGLLALVNASSSCTGNLINGVPDIGFASPLLYTVAANPAAYAASFSDITVGDNDVYGQDNGLTFPARTGYDLASGLGSPQLTTPSGANALAYYLCQASSSFTPPTVTTLSPSSGSTAGGNSIDVTGSGFGTAGAPRVRSVTVGGGRAPSFTVVNNTTLQVTLPAAIDTVPAGSPDPTQDGAGPAHIIVTSTSGESSYPSTQSVYEYVDMASSNRQPSVTGISPSGGVDTARPTVTIYGAGFVPNSTSVDFGGVAATGVQVLSPYELMAQPPLFPSLTTSTACPTDSGSGGQPLSPTSDVCQVSVTVSVNAQTSATAPILKPYEGPLQRSPDGAPVLPAGCNCEDYPQPTEFDYVPAPTITSVSTGTVAQLPANAGSLADEYGGTTVSITGTGLDPLTFDRVTVGTASSVSPLEVSGTSITFLAPAVVKPGQATNQPSSESVSATTIAGESTTGQLTYAGLPTVTGAATASGNLRGAPASSACPSPPPADGCGTPITLTGSGFNQAVGPLQFTDAGRGDSFGSESTYTLNSDTSISTQTVAQNPGVVDVEVCSMTGCLPNPPADYFDLYPLGNPSAQSVAPASGVSTGGTRVRVTGSNLGCVTGVFFGSKPARSFANATTATDCGSTTTVIATAPPGTTGSSVLVTLTTIESTDTGFGHSTSSARFRYTAPPRPSNTAPPSLSGTAEVGKTLIEHHGRWTGNPTSYTYRWERCNPTGGACVTITGATRESYKLSPRDVGHEIRVQEIARNAGGASSPATSRPTAVVKSA